MGAALCAACGCSLGLDRSLLDRDAHAGDDPDAPLLLGPDGTLPDALDGGLRRPSLEAGDAEAVEAALADDGASAADAPSIPSDGAVNGAQSCTTDTQCPQDLAHCGASSCGAGGFCTPTATYHFVATHFAVGAAAAPRSSLSGPLSAPPYAEAIAAAYPYVFIVTPGGVIAFDVSSPVNGAPRRVPISFLPAGVVAAVALGPLVYFVAGVSGSPNGAYQAVAWLDVTGTAGAMSLQAHLAPQLQVTPMAPQVPTSITSLFNVLPAWPMGIFLVYYSNNEATYYPTAETATPSASDTLVPFWNQALVTGAELAVASGSRLIAYTYDSLQPKLALVSGAGTSGASVSPQTTAPIPAARQAAFASNPGGAVLWTSALVTSPTSPITAARLTRLLSDGSATVFAASGAANTFVDLEHYAGVAQASTVVAPPVWLDGKRALGLALDHAALSDTAVHVVTCDTSLALAPGFASLPIDPATVGAASSNGLAYALGARNGRWTVYVLAPACP
ncbi:MAG: hypothetical protein M3O36_10685 [Myxococcota bacterium]|nr:hypothetical protein [Myxococcota bacterium]